MGKINVQSIKEKDLYQENTFKEYQFVSNEKELDQIFNIFLHNDFNQRRFNYLYGFGSQPKSVYKILSKRAGNQYEVLWYGYNGPLKFKWLSYISASTGGFIKLVESGASLEIIQQLRHQSMVGFYSLSEIYSANFEKMVLANVNDSQYSPESFIKMDKSYFYFVVDGDTYDEDLNGFLCKCGMGSECPDFLSEIIEFTNRRW